MVVEVTGSDMAEVKRYLSILASVALRPAMSRFEREILKTGNRVKIFKAFDGSRNPNEVAEIANVTGQAVRDLIKDMRAKGYVSVPESGAQVATIQYEAILDWFYLPG